MELYSIGAIFYIFTTGVVWLKSSLRCMTAGVSAIRYDPGSKREFQFFGKTLLWGCHGSTFTGGIFMRKMSRPYAFESMVRGYQKRIMVISEEEEKRTRDRELEQAIQRKKENPFRNPGVETLLSK